MKQDQDVLLDVTWKTTMNYVSYIFALNPITKCSGSSNSNLTCYEGTDYDATFCTYKLTHCSIIKGVLGVRSSFFYIYIFFLCAHVCVCI